MRKKDEDKAEYLERTKGVRHPLVEKIFRDRILDGHLQDCQITLGDIEKMKESFLTTLRTMNHNRIAYPKPESEAVSQEAASSASGGTPAAS